MDQRARSARGNKRRIPGLASGSPSAIVRNHLERSDAVEYLDSQGHDPLSDDVDPSEALPEEDDELIDLDDFEAPEDLDSDEQIVEDEPA
jgi:hypothetical protein